MKDHSMQKKEFVVCIEDGIVHLTTRTTRLRAAYAATIGGCVCMSHALAGWGKEAVHKSKSDAPV